MSSQLKRLYIALLGWKWKVDRTELTPGWGVVYTTDNKVEFEYHISLVSPNGKDAYKDIYLTDKIRLCKNTRGNEWKLKF